MASADLLLHPVRLRILKAFLGDRALTTSELAAELSDVPPGSLYRHVATLTRAGVLQVVAERRVRGAVERTYTMRLAAAAIRPSEVKAMTLNEHAHAFTAYIAGLMADFERYIASAPADPVRDGAGYRVSAMWLTDDEYADLAREISAVFQERLANAPGKGRRRRMIYTVTLPGSESAAAGVTERLQRAGGTCPRQEHVTYRGEVRRGHAWLIGWRWILVLTGVVVLCCVPVLVSALPASVPKLTPQQLEERILGSQRESFSGYAESDATFGLPPLPAFSSVTPLLDGLTRMRVWHAAPDHWRVDTLSDTGENDTYQVGGDTFVWDSGEQLLTGIYGRQVIRLPRTADLMPQALAIQLITEAGSGAAFSLLPPRRVAGQSAAGLEIRLASSRSTIAQADIWVAPGSGLPLLVQVFGRGSAQPALQTQFLQAGPWTPDSAVVTPQHAPGTGFTTTTPANFTGVLQNLDDEVLPGSLAGFARERSPVAQIGVYGSGLTTFAVLTFRRDTGYQLLNDALKAGATPLTSGDGRGAVASAPLVNLVLVHPYASPDTFLLVGLVSRAALEQAAGVLATKPDQDLGH